MTPARLRRYLEKSKGALANNLPDELGRIVILCPSGDNPDAAYFSNLPPRAVIILVEGLIKEMKGKMS